MPIRKIILSALFTLHFAALFLNNLPWSPFIAALYPKYAWYIRLTGQGQNWSMYTHPDRNRSRFSLTAYYQDQRREDRPWGSMTGMDPRKLYFLEGLFMRKGGETAADRFLDYLLARYPEDDHPVRLELVLETWTTPGYDAPAPSLPLASTRREIVRYR